jgi:tRNA-dihydrouridine synthase A
MPGAKGDQSVMTASQPAAMPGTRRSAEWPLSIAPMMERTDRHYRYFMRQITHCTLLYTEMITASAILRGNRDKLLGFSSVELPLALQLGGDDPEQLAECARLAEDWGYSEVNLNVGCPSDRVQSGHFGACLMAQPMLVARCVAAMRRVTTLPVTVKHRIGINGLERYEDLARFVRLVARAGCDRFIVHARIAVLQGLSPRENRTVPPLRYTDVYRLKADFPELVIEINGGITTLAQASEHLRAVDGVMIGRAAYDNPYLFALADALYFATEAPRPTRRQVIEAMIPYVEQWVARGVAASHILRHMLGLFAHQRLAKAWKRFLSTNLLSAPYPACLLRDAIRQIPDDVLDLSPQVPALPHTGNTL